MMNKCLLPAGLFLLAALSSPISEAIPTPLATGVTHTFVLRNDGTLLAWGNAASAWSEPLITLPPEPQMVMDEQGQILTDIKAVAGSDDYYLALKNDGTLFSWRIGHFVNGLFDNRIRPVSIVNRQGQAVTGIRDIAVGSNHAVALTADGTLLSWGINSEGQLGNDAADADYPVAVNDAQGQPIADIRAIAAAGNHSLALKNDGSLLAWGDNDFGELGIGNIDNQLYPVPVIDSLGVPLSGIASVAAGINHTLALKNDGTLLSWGSNAYGQLGSASPDDLLYPVPVVDDSGLPIDGVQSISAGWDHSLALKQDGTLLIWGNDGQGQLGDGLTSARTHPMIMTDNQGQPLTNIVTAAGGKDHTVILKMDGTVRSWGKNSFGQLGDGTTNDHAAPVEVLDESKLPVTDAQTMPLE